MSGLGSHSLEARVRLLLPMATIIIAALFDLAIIPGAAVSSHVPELLLPATFFWCLQRPELLPPGMVFAVGFCRDLAGGASVGMTPALLLVLRQTVVHQDRFLHAASPYVVWFGFALFATAAAFVRWFAASALAWHWQDIVPSGADLLLTILFWPVVNAALARIQTMLPRVRHAAGG